MLKISLITVSFNSQSTIEDTILSVKSQTFPNIEYIVIDGGSSDETHNIIKKYPDVIAFSVSESDDGIYDAMNKGINHASGDIVGFINADDVLYSPAVLEKVSEVLSDETIEACYADLEYVDQFNLNKVRRYWKSTPFEQGLFAKGWSPPHPTFYVKKSVYDRFGTFSLDYKMGNDIELMLRFLERYHIKSKYVPETWVKMRVGGVSNKSIANVILQNKEIFRAAKDNQIPFSIFTFLRGKIKNRLLQYMFKR